MNEMFDIGSIMKIKQMLYYPQHIFLKMDYVKTVKYYKQKEFFLN